MMAMIFTCGPSLLTPNNVYMYPYKNPNTTLFAV